MEHYLPSVDDAKANNRVVPSKFMLEKLWEPPGWVVTPRRQRSGNRLVMNLLFQDQQNTSSTEREEEVKLYNK